MCKFCPRVYRKDSQEDHTHSMPDGKMTGGMLMKPSKDRFNAHSHLYHESEETKETGIMHDLPGHVHSTEIGDTSGPQRT